MKAELLCAVKTLESQDQSSVEEVRQLPASVAVYRDLAKHTLQGAAQDLCRRVAPPRQFTEPETAMARLAIVGRDLPLNEL